MLDESEEAVWRPYPEYPFIEANQFGEVRIKDRVVTDKIGRKHFRKRRMLKQRHDRGYRRVDFSVNGKKVRPSVHRIVATCFLPNPDNLPEVNHKDCNRANNNVNNLEWCTHEYNTTYREEYGKAQSHPTFAVNLKTGEVSQFKSQCEAERQLGVDRSDIYRVLKGQTYQAGGYWFTEDEDEITEEKICEIKDNMNSLDGVVAINLKSLEVSRFGSQREAACQLGVLYQSINKVLKGRLKTTGGFWFCYVNLEAVEKTRAKFDNDVASEVEKLIRS